MIAELIDALGVPAVDALCREFGGRRLYVPRRPPERLIDALGKTTAAALCFTFAGCRLDVPSAASFAAAQDRARRNLDADRMLLDGASFAATARATGLSRKTIARRAENLIRNRGPK